MSKKVPSNTNIYYSCFLDEIKYLCLDKVNKKDCLILYIVNNKKNLMLIYLSKILRVDKYISHCQSAIIWDNDNNDK